MPTVEHFVLLIGFALLAIVWWYEDTRLARKCDNCGAAKEPGARWCEPCEEERQAEAAESAAEREREK